MTSQDDESSDGLVTPASRLSRVPLIGHVLGNPALRNRDFHKLCGGTAFNSFGLSGEIVIIGILTFEITQSSAWVGIAMALYFLPMLVFGLLSGVIADWMDRRTLLRRVEIAIVVNLLIFSALIPMAPAELWLILVFAVASGSIRIPTVIEVDNNPPRRPSKSTKGTPSSRVKRSCRAMSTAASAAGVPLRISAAVAQAAPRCRESLSVRRSRRSSLRAAAQAFGVSPVMRSTGAADPRPISRSPTTRTKKSSTSVVVPDDIA